MYRAYNARPVPHRRTSRKTKKPLWYGAGIVLLAGTYLAYTLLRPLPTPSVVVTPPVMPALVRVNLPWPTATTNEQAAYGAVGYGLLASKGPETPVPTASVAKVITALAVLDKKPLAAGQQGPTITLSQHDNDLYYQYVAKDGSAVPVVAGQTISEYQALQALMLPSANNIADSLAEWVFGSSANYTTYANGYVKKLGMQQTTVTDASGFAPATVSTASDLVRLGEAAIKNPALAQIVNQKTAEFPGYGTIRNVNALLGQSGIRGIKTGNTDEAGGCFLGAADQVVDGKTITVITAVMAAPDLGSALRATTPLVQTTQSLFQTVHVVRAGQTAGQVHSAWGSSSDIVASSDLSVTAWSGTALSPKVSTENVSVDAVAGTPAGHLDLTANGQKQTSELKLARSLSRPTVLWRLTHPL